MNPIVIFCGPTLDAQSARELLPSAVFRGPAACGDILKAALEEPAAIGLIDGYFEHQLSVWHKEILWAMSKGIAVYGAASLGALRAAELSRLGMVGVGWVFEAYAGGHLEDDDEVAVTHESAEFGYRPTSEAMVNFRTTLARAVDEGILTSQGEARLVAALKATFYPERHRRMLLEAARTALSDADAQSFCRWLESSGVINQKRLDACAMLQRMNSDCCDGVLDALRARPSRHFPHSSAWQALVETVAPTNTSLLVPDSAPTPRRDDADLPVSNDDSEARATLAPPVRQKLRELSLHRPSLHTAVVQLATDRALALALAADMGLVATPQAAQIEADQIRRDLGLDDAAETARWLRETDLDVEAFSSLVHDTLLAEREQASVREAIESQLPASLRLLGLYPRRAV